MHLIEINPKENKAVSKETADLYAELSKAGIDVLWDDRDETAGTKFNDADLIGIPTRLIVSEKTIAENVVEMKLRVGTDSKKVSRAEILREIK